MSGKLKKIFVQIFATKIGWLIISLLCAGIFGIFSQEYFWAEVIMYLFLIYPLTLTIITLIYAWIVNPLKDKKNGNS